MKHDKQLVELKEKSRAELEKLAVELRAKVWHYRIDLASGKTKNIKEIQAAKKTIARALTIVSGLRIAGK
jgi:ribosomal protein L29